jgi:hypothetical protein
MTIRKGGCTNVLFWLAVDSQMLAPSAWIRNDTLMGMRPALDVKQCEELFAKPVAERNGAVKGLNLINGVELFMACSAGDGCKIDVALFWNGQNDSKAAVGYVDRVTNVLASVERCAACVQSNIPCIAICPNCERARAVCAVCLGKGFTQWSHLSRKCMSCQHRNCDCLRCTALGVTSDQEAKNVSTFKALRRSVAATGSRLLALVHDPYHQVRGQRNVAGGYFLERNGEWFSMSFVLVLRCASNVEIANLLIAHCSESALLAKDKHSMDLALIALRPEVENAMKRAQMVVQTLYPCPYRPWLQSAKVDFCDPRYLTASRNRNLWISCTTILIRGTPSFPMSFTRVAGTGSAGVTEAKANRAVRLSAVRFQRLTGTIPISDRPSRLVLMCADAGAGVLLSLHIQFKVGACS